MNHNFTLFSRFLIFALLQILVFSQFEFGFGIHVMIYPLFIMLIPFHMNIFFLLIFGFSIGFILDVFNNTYGLHASSGLIFAYCRPILFKTFSPRDGYDPLKEPNILDMGSVWFLKVFSILLLIHHFWFFCIEMFSINEISMILRNTITSVPVSIVFCLLISLLVSRRKKS